VAAGSPRIDLAMAGGYDNEEPLLYDVFPEDFQWGVATASYQVKFFRVQTLSNYDFARVSIRLDCFSHNIRSILRNSWPARQAGKMI
jgi:hypothetical protein